MTKFETKFERISGVISASTNLSSISGSIDTIGNQVHGTIGTEHWINFRVNSTPCRMKGTANLNIGDLVTVVGIRKGELDILVLVNETSN